VATCRENSIRNLHARTSTPLNTVLYVMTKVLVSIVLVSILGFVGITYVALESGGVVEVETWNSEESNPRMTHIWFVRGTDKILLEAGHPENPWVKDLSSSDTIKIRGNGIDGEYRFKLVDDQSAHSEIRELMHKKYGWRDSWISCIFDVDKSMLVEISPT